MGDAERGRGCISGILGFWQQYELDEGWGLPLSEIDVVVKYLERSIWKSEIHWAYGSHLDKLAHCMAWRYEMR